MSIWSWLGGAAGGIGGFLVGGPAGALAGAGLGAGIGGQADANNANAQMAADATQANIQSAKDQMAFQERMSDTQYQRGVADMKAAGINPMLAISNGGASSPSGSSASAVTMPMQDVVGKAVSNATDMLKYSVQKDQADSQIALNDQLQATSEVDATLKSANARTAEANAKIAEAQIPAALTEAQTRKTRADISNNLSNYDAYAERLNRDTGTVSNALGVLKSLMRSGKRGSSIPMTPSPLPPFSDEGIPSANVP